MHTQIVKKQNMKKVIEELAKQFNCSTSYSGAIRVMFIKGEKAKEFIAGARTKYPNLAFELSASEPPGHIQVYSGSKVDESLAERITNKAMEFVAPPKHSVVVETSPDDLDEPYQDVYDAETKESKEELRAEVDAYLLSNAIDKTQKGFWATIAKNFKNCTGDYVRKRHDALKKKELVN